MSTRVVFTQESGPGTFSPDVFLVYAADVIISRRAAADYVLGLICA